MSGRLFLRLSPTAGTIEKAIVPLYRLSLKRQSRNTQSPLIGKPIVRETVPNRETVGGLTLRPPAQTISLPGVPKAIGKNSSQAGTSYRKQRQPCTDAHTRIPALEQEFPSPMQVSNPLTEARLQGRVTT